MKDHKAGFFLVLLSRGPGRAGGHVPGEQANSSLRCSCPSSLVTTVTLVSDVQDNSLNPSTGHNDFFAGQHISAQQRWQTQQTQPQGTPKAIIRTNSGAAAARVRSKPASHPAAPCSGARSRISLLLESHLQQSSARLSPPTAWAEPTGSAEDVAKHRPPLSLTFGDTPRGPRTEPASPSLHPSPKANPQKSPTRCQSSR